MADVFNFKGLSLAGATTSNGHAIPVYDDWGDSLFLVEDMGGNFSYPVRIIRARSWEAAYEINLDESPTVPQSEAIDCYGWTMRGADRDQWRRVPDTSFCDLRGFTRETRRAYFESTGKVFHNGVECEPDLIEGYEYQSNGIGTGIVDVGHYLQVNEIDPGYLRREGIRLAFSVD